MEIVEIDLAEHSIPPNIAETVEQVCADAGLTATLVGTLKSYPGSTHWHFKKGRERGVLEITVHPGEHRLWLSARPGRDAPWIAEAFRDIGEKLRTQLVAARRRKGRRE